MNHIDCAATTAAASAAGTDRPANIEECQLQTLYDGATELTWGDQLYNRLLQARSYLQDHWQEARQRLRLTRPGAAPGAAPATPDRERLKAGDLVEVLSLEEIRRTLDAGERCAGMKFMKPMAAFCGQRHVVQVSVRRMYNERHERMMRLRRTVLLRDVLCDGRYLGDREGCDRCCFFFWKEDWLRKVEPESRP